MRVTSATLGQQQVPASSGKNNPAVTNTEKELQIQRAKIVGGLGIGALALGTAFKDGLIEGSRRIGSFSSAISHMLAVPFSFLFPFVLLKNEHSSLLGKSNSGDETILNRMVYTCASLGFAPVTFSEPFKLATRSTGHLIATLINSPHILYTFFTYTGGRFFSFLKAFEKSRNVDKSKEYRLEQEFNSLYKLGNLGSSQASVIPMSGQFIMGWQTIGDIFKGDFSSAWNRFKHEPISTSLGTFFNSWMWPAEWLGKVLDTTIRTAESVDQFKGAFQKGAGLKLVHGLEALKNKWHKLSQERNNPFGKCLYYGREGAKIGALLLPPVGMVSVVWPTMNKFLRGEFFNKEAQNLSGISGKFIGLFDKVFSTSAFFSHLYFTNIYALSVRLPQTITTMSFYLTSLYNKMRGVKFGQKEYIDPLKVREKIFNKKFVDKLTKFSEKVMDGFNQTLFGKNAVEMKNGVKVCKYVRTFAQTMAEEVCWEPIREKHYTKLVESKGGFKPEESEWKQYVEDHKDTLQEEAEKALLEYLKASPQFTNEQVKYFKDGAGKQDWESINNEVSIIMDNIIKKPVESKEDENKPRIINKVEIPKRFIDCIFKPKALLEIIKLRTFNAANTFLPLWIKGFVNVVDYGKENEEWWYRNFKAQESGIREGDIKQACDREFMPVVSYVLQNAGRGMAWMHGIWGALFKGEALTNYEDDYAMAA